MALAIEKNWTEMPSCPAAQLCLACTCIVMGWGNMGKEKEIYRSMMLHRAAQNRIAPKSLQIMFLQMAG